MPHCRAAASIASITRAPSYRRTFLSHAHADNALCARFAAALRARGIDCWLDLDNAQKGHALSEDIEQQLDTRSAFLLMVTSASTASHWVALELNNYTALWADQATHLLDGQERLILPVRLEDVPIPTRVRGFNWIDAANQPFDQVVDQIARALATSANPAQPPIAPTIVGASSGRPPLPGEPAPPRPLHRRPTSTTPRATTPAPTRHNDTPYRAHLPPSPLIPLTISPPLQN